MGNHPSKERPDHFPPSDRRGGAPVPVGSHPHRLSATSPTSPTHPPSIGDGLGHSSSNQSSTGNNSYQPALGYRPSPSSNPSSSSNPRDRSNRRSSRHDISLFGLAVNHHGGHRMDLDPSNPDARKETRAEREARKLAKEREARKIERERSIKEESIDGGYMVTLGVYTGTEDFSKPIVRQLMLERRIAPFWKGLNDLDTDLKDNQLVAAVRGLPIPEPEENLSPVSTGDSNASAITSQTINLAASPNDTPIPSPSHAAFPPSPTTSGFPQGGLSTPVSPSSSVSSSAMLPPFFRGRAKTLASTISSSFSRNNSQSELHHSSSSLGMPLPPEIRLPDDPTTVNGRPIEAVLYSEAIDCPICFLSYPPFLNKTRCCDQPICSECFVQIKRPDPHPPENHGDEPGTPNPDPAAAAVAAAANSEEFTLVSEPATCPYCKMPEFGITYEPPPFRRGLAYAPVHSMSYSGQSIGSHSNMHHLHKSAMSSSSSISSSLNSGSAAPGEHSIATPIGGSSTPTGSTATRHRRNQSVSADAPNVITTDRIRPDWAKKLADMRAHALRRAAAATALHNAAYMLGNLEAQAFQRGESSRGVAVFRRRRNLFFSGNPGQPNPAEEPHNQNSDELLGPGRSPSTGDIFPGRMSSVGATGATPLSRRSRMEDLEELMMMEAIRQSIAAEEDRKRKEELEKQKEKDKGKDGNSSAVPITTAQPSTPLRISASNLPHLATSLPTHTAHPLSMSMSMPRSPTTSESGASSTSDAHAGTQSTTTTAIPPLSKGENVKKTSEEPPASSSTAVSSTAPKNEPVKAAGVIEGIERDSVDKKQKDKGKAPALNPLDDV